MDRQRRDRAIRRLRRLRAAVRHDVPAAKQLRTEVWYASSTMTWPPASRSQPELRSEIVGRILPDGEEDLVTVERQAALEVE